MLWVYGHYKYFYSYSAGIYFWRRILTSKVDPRAVRVKVLHMLHPRTFISEHIIIMINSPWLRVFVCIFRSMIGFSQHLKSRERLQFMLATSTAPQNQVSAYI